MKELKDLLEMFGDFAVWAFTNEGPYELRSDGRLALDEHGKLRPGWRHSMRPGEYVTACPVEYQRRYYTVGTVIWESEMLLDYSQMGRGRTLQEAIDNARQHEDFAQVSALCRELSKKAEA